MPTTPSKPTDINIPNPFPGGGGILIPSPIDIGDQNPGGKKPSDSVAPNLPFGFGKLPIFSKGFWLRAGVLLMGVMFIWWAVLIFVAQTKAGKAVIGLGKTAAKDAAMAAAPEAAPLLSNL